MKVYTLTWCDTSGPTDMESSLSNHEVHFTLDAAKACAYGIMNPDKELEERKPEEMAWELGHDQWLRNTHWVEYAGTQYRITEYETT